MSVKKEYEMVELARKMDLFTVVYVGSPEEARAMADVGADSIIAHVGTTVGGSIGVVQATASMDDAVRRTEAIIKGGQSSGRDDIYFLCHGGPLAWPEDAQQLMDRVPDCIGFVGASSLERLGVEQPLIDITKRFKAIRTDGLKQRV